MLGESHCIVFTDRIFQETRYLHETFITRCMFLPGISSHDFADDGHRRVLAALWAEHLVIVDPRAAAQPPTALHTARVLHIPSVASNQPRGVPVLMIFAGEIALRSIFLRKLGNTDFEVPFETPGLEALPPAADSTNTPFSMVLDLATQVLSPLFNGLVLLRDMGFTSLYLHSIPPPTLDDEEFEKIHGFASPVRLRYKSTMLFNRVLKDTCAQYNIRFLDIWDDVTVDNLLDEQFAIDGVHLNSKAAYITLQKLMESLVHEDRASVAARYEYLSEQAKSWFIAENPACADRVSRRYQRDGLVTGALDPAAVAAIRAELDFSETTENRHIRLDWNGASVGGWQGNVALGTVTPLGAELLYRAVYAEPVASLLRSCMQSDYVVVSVKALKFSADSSPDRDLEAPHLDATPAGAIRAVVYLNDVSSANGPLTCTTAQGTIRGVTGPPGTLIVFDGQRVRHQWIRPRAGEREALDMVLIPRDHRLSRGVIWPGMNNWPVDPYKFSTRDFACYPTAPLVRLAQPGDKWWQLPPWQA
jgi:hypothetical protein